MIRPLILSFLSAKLSHGYEIQRFIRLNGLDSWTKIQSGSIYHALARLESEGAIEKLRSERTGARERIVYALTDLWRRLLADEVRLELAKPLGDGGSDKFLLSAFIDAVEEPVAAAAVAAHLEALEAELAGLERWRAEKRRIGLGPLDEASFELLIGQARGRIARHRVLLAELPALRERGAALRRFIAATDFSGLVASGLLEAAARAAAAESVGPFRRSQS